MKGLIFLQLPLLVFALKDTTCPAPWPTPSTRRMGESCSCETGVPYGLRVKCSWVYDWPASTPANTGELLLDGTRINKTLHSSSLAGFAPALQIFSCNDCGIENIEKFAFFGLNVLNTISLENNAISTINSYAFAGLKNLTTLNLKNSGIFTIEPSAFFGLNYVQFFDLSMNSLYAIKVNAFQNVTNIDQINFDQIKAERIKSYTLKGLRHIGSITFKHSEVRKLEAYSFFGVDNISTLSFHSSDVRDIMPYAFVGLGKVKSINLMSTEVSTLSCEALEGLECVGSVQWALSPIRCDCNIQWMVELSANISRDITKGLICASPYQFRSKSPFELEKDELGCNDEERFMGCAPLDTRFPRVKKLERYMEDIKRPTSIATAAIHNISLILLSVIFYVIH